MNDTTPYEHKARAFVQYLEDRIKAALSPAAAKAVVPDDKASLERALDALRRSFDELAKQFFDPVREQNPSLCEHGYWMLWRVMGGAFNAGARATVSDSAKQYTFNEKAQNARDVRAQKTKLAIEARRNAVRAEVEANRCKREPAVSDDYANFIHEGVTRRVQEIYPAARATSVSTVRNEVRTYLKTQKGRKRKTHRG